MAAPNSQPNKHQATKPEAKKASPSTSSMSLTTDNKEDECRGDTFRIATFNIALGATKFTKDCNKAKNREYENRTVFSNLYDITKLISKRGIDLIGLQEVDHMTQRIKHHPIDDTQEIVNTAQKYFNQTYLGQFTKAIDFHQGEYGNAILYKSKQLQQMQLEHCVYSNVYKEARSAMAIQFKYGKDDNKQLWFVTTHLSYDEETAVKQFSELMQFTQDYKGPTVVCGDFNIAHGSNEYKAIHEKWTNNGFEDVGPFKVKKPEFMYTNPRKRNKKIDYILIRNTDKKARFQIRGVDIIQPRNQDKEWFSDHWALVADVELR